MNRILAILFLLIPLLVKGQTYPPVNQGAKLYIFKNGIGSDSALFLPRRDTNITDATMKASGMLLYRTADSLLYYLKGNTMTPLAGGVIPPDSLSTLTIENISALRSSSYNLFPNKKSVYVRGYYTAGDGGGGNFYWSDTSTMADNGGTVIKVTSITTGRWKRIITGDVDFRMFGARGDSVSDDSDPIQRAIDAFQQPGVTNSGAHFTFSKGRYLLANVLIKSGTYIDAYQAARDNYIPNVPVTIAAYGNPDYIIDVDSAATNWSIRNLSIDGDFSNQPQLLAAVRLRGQKGYFTGNNVNRCAQYGVQSEAGIVFIEKNGIYGWYGSGLPTFTGINDFRGALDVPSFGDAYITKNEIGAGLNYFTSTVTPRDPVNGRIVALALGKVFGGTGWVSENYFENGDKAVAIGNSLYCEFYFNRYELSAIGGLHIYGPAQYLGFTGERFSDNSLTADSAADNIIIGIGAAGHVVFSHPTFERLVNGAIPNSSFKSRWGLRNYGSVEIDLTTPKIDTSYITGLVDNVDVSALPVRQVVGQYDPRNPIYNSVTAGGTGNRDPWSALDTLGAVKLIPGTTTSGGDFTGAVAFLKPNGDVHSEIGFDNFNDLTFTIYGSLGKYILSGGEVLLAKPGNSGMTIQSNDAAGDPHINMQTGTKTAGYTLDHTTGDVNYIASGGFTYTTGNGTPFTSIGGNGTFAKAGGLDFSLIADNTGASNFRISSDVLSANSFNIGFNNVTGNTAITGSADITVGNNWKYDVSGFNYIPTTPTSAGGDTTYHFLAWNHADKKVIIKSNVYWDSTKIKSYVASSSPAAITSLNGLTDAVQTFSTGTTGTDFNIVSTSGNHVFNMPDASASNRGAVTTGTQTFTGLKTFSTGIQLSGTNNNIYSPIVSQFAGTTNTTYTFGGASTIYGRVMLGGNTANTLGVNSTFGNIIAGKVVFTTAGSGTHPYAGNIVALPMAKSGGTAAVTNLANILSLGAPTAGTNNYNLLTDSGTVALNPTAGNVGIGVATPTSKLHVNGDIRVDGMAAFASPASLFVVSNGGILNTRTTSQVLADIGAARLDSLYHALDTLNNWLLSGYTSSLLSNNHTGEGFICNIGGDTLINIFRSDSLQSHLSNGGKIVQRFSYDAGITWTTTTTIFNTSNDDRNVIGTITSTGRLVAILRQYNANTSTPVNVGFISSTDKGQTWSAYTTLSPLVSGLTPMGNIIRTGDGSYLALLYTINYCEAFRSTNNGSSWTSQGVIYDYRVSNPTRQTSEPYAAYVGANRVIMLVRNENLTTGPYYQLNSSDNGQTFTFQGNTNIGGDTLSRTAPFIMWDSLKNTVLSIGCQRHVYSNAFVNNYRDTKNDSLVLYLNHPVDVFTTPTNYTKKISFVRPEPDIRGFYGYPTATQLKNGTWFFIFSDENALNGIDPDGNDGRSAHLFQFDLAPVNSYYNLDSCRYGGLVRQYNQLTGKYDNVRPYSNWVKRFDSTLVNLANSTLKIVSPMWSDSASVLNVVGRNDNAIKFNILGNGFADFYNRIKVRGGNPGVNKVLTDLDGTGQATWGANDLQTVTANGNFTTNALISYGNVFARFYKFVNAANNGEPVFSPFFKFDDTTHTWLWGNANRSAARLDTLGNLRLLGAFKPNGLPGTVGDLLMSQGDNVPAIWTNLVNLANSSGIRGTSTGSSNLAIFRFFESDGTTLKGIVGDGASGDQDIYLSSTNGIKLSTGGTVRMQSTSAGLTAFGLTSPTSILDIQGSIAAPIRSVSSSATLAVTDYTIRVTTSGITLTFPAASSCTGRVYVIINYNTGGNINTSAFLSPAAVSTTTVATGTTVWVQSDGTNWYQIK